MKKGLRHHPPQPKVEPTISTADLMKKGLRPSPSSLSASLTYFNRRPDEEGIKTPRAWWRSSAVSISTADLMKKGLRPGAGVQQGGLRGISTADLMKKGLRRGRPDGSRRYRNFNRRPDEEGIKTFPPKTL